MAMHCTDALNKARATAAELAFSGYDFGLLINDSGSWAETHTDDWVRYCYGEDDNAAERYRIALKVRFEKGSAKPVEVYALDLKFGGVIGTAGSVDVPAAEESVATYNHAFTIAFSVPGSKCPDGEDVTAEQMAAALQLRIKDLMANNEMLEAVGAPYDTYKEQ